MTHHLYPSPPFSPEADGTLYPANDHSAHHVYSAVTQEHIDRYHGKTVHARMPNRLQEELTQQTLDSLVSFYHQGQAWIDRTRASMEAEPTGTLIHRQLVKAEVDGDDEWYEAMTGAGEQRELSPRRLRQATAARRKALGRPFSTSSLGARHGSLLSRFRAQGGREGQGGSAEILNMFERMLVSRMESCERMNRLVRGASGYR